MKSVSDILLDLIAIPSVSSISNQPVIDFIGSHLDPNQWDVRFYPVADPAGVLKTNMIAVTKHARGQEPELALVCHTDTVPYDANWEAAVHPELRDGRVYGRGSCDVKGFLACVLATVGSLDLGALEKPLALVFTADEEIGCLGAKSLARAKAFSCRYLLIGEPTGLSPVRAGKGYGLANIVVRGAEAHSAFPSKGRSAIYDAARVISRLEQVAAQLENDINSDFEPPFTTVNIGLIEGGTAKNIVAGECRLTVEWRPIPGQNPGLVPELLKSELARLSREKPGFHAEVEVARIDPAFAPSETRTLADLLASMADTAAGTISFGSEAAHLFSLAAETVVFGPGDMTVAHKTGEFVEVADLERCVAFLGSLAARILRPGEPGL